MIARELFFLLIHAFYPNASTKQFLALEHLFAPLSLVHKSKLDIKISILLPATFNDIGLVLLIIQLLAQSIFQQVRLIRSQTKSS